LGSSAAVQKSAVAIGMHSNASISWMALLENSKTEQPIKKAQHAKMNINASFLAGKDQGTGDGPGAYPVNDVVALGPTGLAS
jgi:hypothetical protein